MTLDMTKGDPKKVLLTFFIPLFLGDLLQQFYGIIDAVVIGKYVGTDAFAAVGASSAVTVFITSILLGLSLGASSVFSKFYGAQDYDKLRKSIATALIFLFVISSLITFITLIFLPQIITLFRMPIETAQYANDYLYYVFWGFIFVGMYNAFSFILRAFGDSKTPLYFLIFSCFTNLFLDIYFVKYLKMGTAGASLATLITQAFAAIGCGFYTFKKLRFIEFCFKDLKFDWDAFRDIGLFSVLTAVQQSLSSFGMMMIQGLVNTFGATTMAAFAAVSKIDAVANAPLQDLGNALSTYTAQNLGAQKYDRIEEGFRVNLRIITVISVCISIIAYCFAPQLILIFVSNESIEVIAIGVHYLRIVSIFYILLGLIVMFYGFFRGLGKVKISIMLTIVSQCLRVGLAYSFAPLKGFTGVCWAIVVGWLISDVLGFYCYKKVMNPSKRDVKLQEEMMFQD